MTVTKELLSTGLTGFYVNVFLSWVLIFGNLGAPALGVIIGRTVGSGGFDLVKAYARTLQVIFLIFGVITGLVIFLAKDLILAAAFRGISPAAPDE